MTSAKGLNSLKNSLQFMQKKIINISVYYFFDFDKYCTLKVIVFLRLQYPLVVVVFVSLISSTRYTLKVIVYSRLPTRAALMNISIVRPNVLSFILTKQARLKVIVYGRLRTRRV